MKDTENIENDRFSAAELSTDQLNSVLTLEQHLRSNTNKDIILIAYEENDQLHNNK